MHLTYADLYRLARGESAVDMAAAHLAQCEFCREALEQIRAEIGMTAEVADQSVPAAALALRDRLMANALRGAVISLTPLESQAPAAGAYLLAADGRRNPRPAVACVREYYSENPELVLRLMRSEPEQRHWVQVVAEDPTLSAHVLLRLPERGQELLTDATGLADLPDLTEADLETLKWEVRLPEVSFTLDELTYDPDRTEYAEETVLESPRADRVRIRFEGKTEGKQVTLEFLNLVGIGEADTLRVFVIEGTEAHATETRGANRASFKLSGSPKKLSIRLFKA